MPRLRYLADGTPVIRTGYTNDDGESVFGTWQIYYLGEQVLAEKRLDYDGARIPMRLFHQLREAKYIWCENPSPRRRSKVRTRSH